MEKMSSVSSSNYIHLAESVDHLDYTLKSLESLPKKSLDILHQRIERKCQECWEAIQHQLRYLIFDNDKYQVESAQQVQTCSHERLAYTLKSLGSLPKKSLNILHQRIERKCQECWQAIQHQLRYLIFDDEEFEVENVEHVQTCISCMAGSTNKDDMRRFLINQGQYGTFQQLCTVCPQNESRCLHVLKHLRKLDLLQKGDIEELNLLRYSCNMSDKWSYENWANTHIFRYLVKWDPMALNSLNSLLRRDNVTLLQELLIYGRGAEGLFMGAIPAEPIKRVIEAGLKYFPNDLGQLLLEAGDHGSPFDIAVKDRYGFRSLSSGWPTPNDLCQLLFEGGDHHGGGRVSSPDFKSQVLSGGCCTIIEEEPIDTIDTIHIDTAVPVNVNNDNGVNENDFRSAQEERPVVGGGESWWPIIEECLDEAVGHDLELNDRHPNTNLYPFMTAASHKSQNYVDLIYYLLRKDPSFFLGFDSSLCVWYYCGRNRRIKSRTSKSIRIW